MMGELQRMLALLGYSQRPHLSPHGFCGAFRTFEGGRIEPHHIRVAVRRDQDLVRLVGPAALEQGGLLRPEVSRAA